MSDDYDIVLEEIRERMDSVHYHLRIVRKLIDGGKLDKIHVAGKHKIEDLLGEVHRATTELYSQLDEYGLLEQ